MAGCSIVFLMIVVMWPFFLVYGIVMLATTIAVEFVTSPAFPLLIISFIFGAIAAIDVLRLLWRWYKERETFVFETRMFYRPLVLAAIAFVFFIVMCIVSGSMVIEWYRSLSSS